MSRCEFCGLLLKNRQKRFCSKRCSSRDINKKRFGVKNKKMCKKCGKDLVGDPRSNFCSRSCSASYNNNKRKVLEGHLKLCKCGEIKDKKAKTCHRCKVKETLDRNNKLQLKEAIYKGNARIKYSKVRSLASKTMEFYKIKKECFCCGFNVAVQVCHIKKISEFSLTDLVGDINDLSNLRYLCPNHHVLLDRNLMDKDTILKKR